MEYGIDKLAVPSVMTLLLHNCWNFKAIAGSTAKPNSLGCCLNIWPSSALCSLPVVFQWPEPSVPLVLFCFVIYEKAI